MQLKLILKSTGETWLLDAEQEYVLGRDAACSLPLSNFSTLSFHHLRLFFDQLARRWCVEDLNSTNGTFIYEQRITSAPLIGTTEIKLSHEVHLIATPDRDGPGATVISPVINNTLNQTVASFETVQESAPAITDTPILQHPDWELRQKNTYADSSAMPANYGEVLGTNSLGKKGIPKNVKIIGAALFCLGCLGAIALPSFLNQANKAKQSEGKLFVNAALNAQADYFSDHRKFAETDDELGRVGLNMRKNYRIEMTTNGSQDVVVMATPFQDGLRAYSGAVFNISQEDGSRELKMLKIVCETTSNSKPFVAPPFINQGQAQCGVGSVELKGR